MWFDRALNFCKLTALSWRIRAERPQHAALDWMFDDMLMSAVVGDQPELVAGHMRYGVDVTEGGNEAIDAAASLGRVAVLRVMMQESKHPIDLNHGRAIYYAFDKQSGTYDNYISTSREVVRLLLWPPYENVVPVRPDRPHDLWELYDDNGDDMSIVKYAMQHGRSDIAPMLRAAGFR
jgi:hypothetical protein